MSESFTSRYSPWLDRLFLFLAAAALVVTLFSIVLSTPFSIVGGAGGVASTFSSFERYAQAGLGNESFKTYLLMAAIDDSSQALYMARFLRDMNNDRRAWIIAKYGLYLDGDESEIEEIHLQLRAIADGAN